MKRLALAFALLALSAGFRTVLAQPAVPEPAGDARLNLTMEVATTTGNRLPVALRFTLTNIGNVPVEVPLPAIECASVNGTIGVNVVIHFDGPKGTLGGHGCGGGVGGVGNFPSLLDRIRTQWFHLRPGEYLTLTGDARSMIDRSDKPATYEYWAVYEPPNLTAKERALAAQNGFIIPNEPVESNSLEFHVP